ncbi:MAG: hypothetical protein KDA96_11495, partial [Planctomycetaceae bacterium]|nr:hypothetical protein [Planctomycetaceae bacterium]
MKTWNRVSALFRTIRCAQWFKRTFPVNRLQVLVATALLSSLALLQGCGAPQTSESASRTDDAATAMDSGPAETADERSIIPEPE